MKQYPITIIDEIGTLRDSLTLLQAYSQVIVLVDENTYRDCYPLVNPFLPESHRVIGIFAGEIHKTLSTCEKVWEALSDLRIDRKACLLNLGGGVIGDLGGFIASTYKRGIDFYQIPTTLLAQVDASVGGKVGIDFLDFKNQIGLFVAPKSVLIYPEFLKTLPKREWFSGFAEVIKHYLIADKDTWEKIKTLLPENISVSSMMRDAIRIKSEIVNQDPFEQDVRKALNFGHTIGHGIESYFIGFDQEQVLHGEAVAAGMICETFISRQMGLLTETECMDLANYLKQHFQIPKIPTFAYKPIYQNILQDKKNHSGTVQGVLLNGIGSTVWDVPIAVGMFLDAMDFYQTMTRPLVSVDK